MNMVSGSFLEIDNCDYDVYDNDNDVFHNDHDHEDHQCPYHDHDHHEHDACPSTPGGRVALS